jgi:hypothetical protein
MPVSTETLRRSERFLRSIHDVAIAARSGFQDEVEGLLELGCREFDFEAGAVVSSLGDDTLKMLYTSASDQVAGGMTFDACNTSCAEVIKRDEPLTIDDASVR